MPILSFAVTVFLMVAGGAAVLMGAVLLLSALTSGVVMMTYVAHGQPIAETVLRADNPDRYWMLVGLIGVLPVLLGSASLTCGWRKLRS